MNMFIVCKTVDTEFRWEMIGIFDTKEKARENLLDQEHYMFLLPVNVPFHEGSSSVEILEGFERGK